MTRQDYLRIARAIKTATDDLYSEKDMRGAAAVLFATNLIARELADDNVRFNRAVFMDACGFPGNKLQTLNKE